MLNGSSERNQRITILEPMKKADGYGGMTTSYNIYGERWAAVSPPAFRQQIVQGAPVSRASVIVEIGPDKAIKRGWHLTWQGDTYEITSADNSYRERTLLAANRLDIGV